MKFNVNNIQLKNFSTSQDVLAKLAEKFLERSEAKEAEEAAEIATISAQKQSERAEKIEKARERIHRNRDERYQDIKRALLLSEVSGIQSDHF